MREKGKAAMKWKGLLGAFAVVVTLVWSGGAAKAQSAAPLDEQKYQAWVDDNNTRGFPSTGTPGQVYTIYPQGAILALKSGNVYDKPPSGKDGTAKIYGHFSAGDHICMESATVGPDGMVTFFEDGDNMSMLGMVAPNDGSFEPDPDNPTQCGGLAEALDSAGKPQEIAGEAAQNAASISTAANDLGKWFGASIPLLIVSGIMTFILSQLYPKPPQATGTPLSEEQRKKLFPGFAIKPTELYVRQNEIIRVNDSGAAIGLHKWNFDPTTGEFHKITGDAGGGRIVVNQNSYKERWRKYWQFSNGRKIWGWPPMLFCCAVALLFIYLGTSENAGFTTGIAICFGIPGFALLPLCLWPKTAFEAKYAGPQPLQRRTDDFGPDAATSPVNHPASDDLDYKPTV